MQNIKVLKNVFFAGIASVILTGSAMAADFEDGAVGPAPEQASPWDIAFGVTIASAYVSRGVQYTSGVAVQPWAEFTAGMFYLGYWGSNTTPALAGGDNWEHDLSIGIRPVVGPVTLDIGYVRYLYNPSGDCCGEVYIKAEVAPVEPLTLGAQFFYSPDTSATYTEVNASVALIDTLSASAAVGFIGNTGADYTTWNAGLTWAPVEPLEIDFRYHSAPSTAPGGALSLFVVSASISTSLSAMGVTQ